MPITKLSRHVALKRKSELKRKTSAANTRKKNAAKKKLSLSSSDWMKFCDLCFEFYVRFRDNWIDTLDGRIATMGDYEHYHACHYMGRGYMATRYIDMNCHGQGSDHNYFMSYSNPNDRKRKAEQAKYKEFMVKKYGKETVDALEEKAKEVCHRSLYDWKVLAFELFGQAAAMDSLRLQERLDKVYKWSKAQRTLELIQSELAKGIDDAE